MVRWLGWYPKTFCMCWLRREPITPIKRRGILFWMDSWKSTLRRLRCISSQNPVIILRWAFRIWTWNMKLGEIRLTTLRNSTMVPNKMYMRCKGSKAQNSKLRATGISLTEVMLLWASTTTLDSAKTAAARTWAPTYPLSRSENHFPWLNIWINRAFQKPRAPPFYPGKISPGIFSAKIWPWIHKSRRSAPATKTSWSTWDHTWSKTPNPWTDTISCPKSWPVSGTCTSGIWSSRTHRMAAWKVSSRGRIFSHGCRCEQLIQIIYTFENC